MKRRVLLLGEGVEDIGRVDEASRWVGCPFEGDLPRLVRRLVEDAGGSGRFGYGVETIEGLVRRIPRQGTPARGGGKAKNLRDAVLSCVEAAGDGAPPAAVIALIDARTHEVAALRRDVASILKQCEERAPDVPVAIGLAIQEVEIWMLADPASRHAAFGPTLAAAAVPADLEAEPDPKARWRERAGKVACPSELSGEEHHDELRRAAWESMRPAVVAHACPQGFPPFAERTLKALSFLLGS